VGGITLQAEALSPNRDYRLPRAERQGQRVSDRDRTCAGDIEGYAMLAARFSGTVPLDPKRFVYA
jgi:hypothetical protein